MQFMPAKCIYTGDPETLCNHFKLHADYEEIKELLKEARAEIDKWGYGDFHYGSSSRESSVVNMLEKIDSFLKR